MNLKSVDEVAKNTTVLFRIDSDLPMEEGKIVDNSRLVKSLNSIQNLLDKNCKIAIIGHRGRPKGKDDKLSLKAIYAEFMSLLRNRNEDFDVSSVFIEDIKDSNKIKNGLANNQIVFLENVRFWSEELENSYDHLSTLSLVCQVFVNDSIATAHRLQASVTICQKMDSYYGFDFIEEATRIEELKNNPKRGILLILGGNKKGKLENLDELLKWADKIIITGKLSLFLDKNNLNQKIEVAKLRQDGLDIDQENMEMIKREIGLAKTIVWAGAVGKFEDESSEWGSKFVAETVSQSGAYKVIGGGDTRACLKKFGLLDRIDFVCSGGGVLLEWLGGGKNIILLHFRKDCL